MKKEKKCDLHLYFKCPDDSLILKINDLIFDHTPTEEKIQKAIKRMEMAKVGKFPKRNPIKVRKLHEGRFLVLDGNTTTTVLKKWGCSEVIAKEIFE